jgi:hypothetical protein
MLETIKVVTKTAVTNGYQRNDLFSDGIISLLSIDVGQRMFWYAQLRR